MATPISFTVYLADGVTRNASATPSAFGSGSLWLAPDGTTAASGPTINNLGVGKFEIETSDAQEAAGRMFLIATGGFPAYVYGALHAGSNPFAAVAFFNADGTPATTGAPTIPAGGYQDKIGNARTAPAPAGGPCMWSVTPSAGDLAVVGGVNWILDAPAGKIPASYDGDLIVGGAAGSSTPPVVGNFSPSLVTPIQSTQSVGFDVTISDGTAFANVSISVVFDSLGLAEEVYDGADFSALYVASSIRATIANGFRFTLIRRGGWPANPKVKVRAVSVTGVLNA